jgi:hypothetical protein
MKRLVWLGCAWLVACSGRGAPARLPATLSSAAMAPPVAAPVVPPHGPAAVVAPHGGRIDRVAITDRGDAALTADSFGEIRLWPVLDGTREPVVVHGPSPAQLALGRDAGGLFAAILDEAGGVELVRFDAGGGVLGRAQLAATPAIEQVVAIPGGVLVRRRDHHLVRFDARGVATGELVPEPGQRLVSLAARRDRALAGITDTAEPRARSARWIALDGALAWGASFELPEPLSDLAIAPGGRRIAGIAGDEVDRRMLGKERGKVIELAPRPLVIGTIALEPRQPVVLMGRRPLPIEPAMIGFAGDDDVVMGAPGQLIWASAGGATPWLAGESPRPEPEGPIAVADRVAAARSAALQLSDRSGDRFLGYRFLGEGVAAMGQRFRQGGGVLLKVEGYGRLWLDPRLGARPPTLDIDARDLELVLDEHHLLFSPMVYDLTHPLSHRFFVRDLRTNTETELAVIADVAFVRYDPGTRVLAIVAGDQILRYRMAFDPVAATPLRTLAQTGELPRFHLTDPALANGVVAVVSGATPRSGASLYRIDGEDRGGPVSADPVALTGPIVAVDRAGAIYVAARGVTVHRDGRPPEALGLAAIDAISHDGRLLVASRANEVTVWDASGVVRWRWPVWHAGPVAWSLDDRTLFVAADGGAALSFDAGTGERLAIRCGWGFGLYRDDVTTSSDTPSACAAP